MRTSSWRTKPGSHPGSWRSAWRGPLEPHGALALDGREHRPVVAAPRGLLARLELGSRSRAPLAAERTGLRRADVLHRVRPHGAGSFVAREARALPGAQRARSRSLVRRRRLLGRAPLAAAARLRPRHARWVDPLTGGSAGSELALARVRPGLRRGALPSGRKRLMHAD